MPTTAKRTPRRVSRRWKDWHKVVKYHRRMIRKFRREISPHGQLWTDKMIAYHSRSVEDLTRNEPEKYER